MPRRNVESSDPRRRAPGQVPGLHLWGLYHDVYWRDPEGEIMLARGHAGKQVTTFGGAGDRRPRVDGRAPTYGEKRFHTRARRQQAAGDTT
jgi:hypothetical protein